MYNKLFTKILDSTIWLEPDATRLVWITFIAIMDEDGFVALSSIGNVAARARISHDAAETAVKSLEAPDTADPSQEHEGKRIERVPYGWMVLNAKKYRDIIKRATAREQTRLRVARHRIEKRNADVTHSNENVTPSVAVAVAVALKDVKDAKASPPGFEELLKALPKRAGNNPKARALRGYRARLAEKHTPQEMLEGAQRYAKYCSLTGKAGTELVLQAATFLGPDKGFLQPWTAANGNGEWWKSEGATLSKGREVGVNARPGESMEEYRSRIRERISA